MPCLKRAIGKSLTLLAAVPLFFIPLANADFINGGFEAPFTPDNTAYSPITGWTQEGYTFDGSNSSIPPRNLSRIILSPPLTPGGITDIIFGPEQTVEEYFLQGASPTPTLLLPANQQQTASINFRPVNTPLTVSGNNNKPPSWVQLRKRATALRQTVTLTNADIDPTDEKIHVRFKLAAVLENPTSPHSANQRPFYAVEVINNTTGATSTNPLFFQWRYASQPGTNWQALITPGTNPGSNATYEYQDWQVFDIAPGNAFLHVGDEIQLTVMASACALGGHDGHVYLDDVSTYVPPFLWVTAEGPQSSAPGQNITYTYRYTNGGTTPVNGVQVVANLPVQANPTTPPVADSTTYVSSTNPTVGTNNPTCSTVGNTAPVTCTIGTLQPGQTGTFQITVYIPANWALSTGPVNNGNYPISGQGINPLFGPLVQTALINQPALSNLVTEVNLPASSVVGQPYSGSFTCSNRYLNSVTLPADAPNASCEIAHLPAGTQVTGCTISPANDPWVEPATIPGGQTVTCNVSGVPTTVGVNEVLVLASAANNGNSSTNQTAATVTITTSPISLVDIPATLNGSVVLNPAVVCCGRPVILGDLPIPGNGSSRYYVSSRTGNVTCFIGQTGSQTYLKVYGRSGSCTTVGVKNGISSNPLTIVAS